MSGTRGHSGAPRRATCQRNGRVYVALDMIVNVQVNDVQFAPVHGAWWVDDKRFTDAAAAAAEFVRRVNAK